MIHIFLISLKRSNERRKEFLMSWAAKGITAIEWVEGVDGSTEDLSKWNIDRNKFHRFWHNPISCCSYNVYYTDNEYGCAISHLNIYKQIVERNIPFALVLEDDAVLVDGYEEVIFKLEEQVSKIDFDVLYLNYNDRLNSFSPLKYFYKTKDEKNVYIKRIGIPNWDWLFNRRKVVYRTSAYIISQKGARKILNKAYPIRLPSDRLLGLIAYNKMIAYKLVPRIVTTNNSPTTIPVVEEIDRLNKKPWYSILAKRIKKLYHK